MAPPFAARWFLLLPLMLAGGAPAAEPEQDELTMMQVRKPAAAEVADEATDKAADMRRRWVTRFRSQAEEEEDDRLGINGLPPLPDNGEADALGLLILTYGYPTQPGDIDDKRSFCTVDESYQCTDGFSIVKAEVHGLEFDVAQNAVWNSTLEESFRNALRALLQHARVRAITANCGFMTNYQSQVEEIMANLSAEEGLAPKPLLMGSLSLGPLLTNQTGGDGDLAGWGLLSNTERAVVVTANSQTLTKNFYDIMDQQGLADPTLQQFLGKRVPDSAVEKIQSFMSERLGIELDDGAAQVDALKSAMVTACEMQGFNGGKNFLQNRGKFFRTYGAQNVTGFGEPVEEGAAHNASLAGPYMNEWVLDTLFRLESSRRNQGKVKGAFVLFECTELPAYANGVRMATRLPVWDITTLGQCLMSAAPSYDPSVHVSDNADFKTCMMAWTNPYRMEPRFGKQPDLTMKGYGPGGQGPARGVEEFDWGLLGKPEGARCSSNVGCFP